MKYENEIREIIAKTMHLTVPNDQISLDTNFKEAGMDSVAFVALVTEIEDYFDFEFSIENLVIENASTIRKINKIVEDAIG